MLFRGKVEWAGRIAWTLLRGEIPEHLRVLHTCDNSLCVNPDHLYLGTAAQNTADMIKRGRRGDTTMPGSRNRFAKLTEDQVRQIRASTETGEALAAIFGVSSGTISKIRRYEKWRHI